MIVARAQLCGYSNFLIADRAVFLLIEQFWMDEDTHEITPVSFSTWQGNTLLVS